MKTIMQSVKIIEESKKDVEFIPTGLFKLDEALDGGFMRKELVVLGAYTGVGKSYIAGQLFHNIAKAGFTSAYFSLEISAETITSRVIGALANIKPTRIIGGYLTADEFEAKKRAIESLVPYDNQMFLYDELYNFKDIEKEITNNAYEFIIVDFLQNVIGNGEDEYSRLSGISLAFQKLAKEKNACILLLSQLSNQAARQGIMEYKGSGSIATVCDLGFFVTRQDAEGEFNRFRLELKKNRRGFSGQAFDYVFQHPGGAII